MARDGLRETTGGIDRGNGIALKAGWSSARVAIVLAVALAGVPAVAIVNLAAQDGGTATQLRATVLSSTPSVLGASGGRGLVPSEASPVPGVGWEALSHASNGLSPPDVQIAVGPDHVVEAVNSALGIYTKLGAFVTNTNLSSLFSSGSDPVGDPRILYDAFSGRWFVSAGAFSRGQVLVAVSKTGDPAGNWSTYQVPAAPTSSCLDQPILGVGTWNLIVSVNAYSSCTSPPYTFEGSQYWVLNKTDLVAGVANPATWASIRNTVQFSVHPVRMESPSPIQYMVSTLWDPANPVSVILQSFAVTGSPPGTVQVTVSDHQMAATAQLPPPAPQRGSFYNLDTGDFRIVDALWSRGLLWLSFNDQCRTTFSRTACARLIELDTGVDAIVQDFWVSSSLRDYFYPALGLDGYGNLAVVVGVSSSNDYPGLLVTGRLRDDPHGEFQPPVPVKAGSGAEESSCSSSSNRCRYGDYFGASPDPTDPTRVWLAGQFARGTSAGWGTYILPARIKAMFTVNYTVDSGAPSPNGPMLHYVRNGTAVAAQVGPTHATFLADPGTSWQIDSSFMSSSGDARYLVRAADEENLHGVANRSIVLSVAYQLEYPVSVDVTSGGSVAYASNSTTGIVESGKNGTFFVFPGNVVTLTARPTSLLYVFAGWSGDLTGSAASQSVTVGGSQSIVARFAPNWAFMAAMGTVGAMAGATLAVVLRRRRRKGKLAAAEPGTPPSPPPAGPFP